MKPYIKWFIEISEDDIYLVGGKGANLGELTKLGLSVPEGFCITIPSYRDFIKDVQNEIVAIADSVDMDDQSDLQKKAESIQGSLLKIDMPRGLTREIVDAYLQLDGDANVPVAIRSSATAEDLPQASFAGQHDTFLNVRGIEPLLRKVKECWASMWTSRAIHYRKKQGYDNSRVGMCVVVQRMIIPSVSGVMFTYNSVDNRDDEILIESIFGLGEGLVSGALTPDVFIIGRDLKIKRKTIAEKDTMFSCSKEGVIKTKVPKNKQKLSTLSDEKILELARTGLKIEEHYETPQDIEWCLSQGRFYILQSRPVTAMEGIMPAIRREELEALEGEWTKSPLDERVQEPLTPFTWSAAQESIPSLFKVLEVFGFHLPADVELVRLFYGRPYVNKTVLEKIFKDLPGVVDDFILGGQVTIDRRKIKPSFSMVRMIFKVMILVNQVHKDWDRELPRIQKEIATLKKFEVEKASTEELLAQVDHILYMANSIAITHALSIIFDEALYQMLVIFVGRFAGEDAKNLCPKLVSGLEGNKTIETNEKLWELSMEAKESEYIRNIILSDSYDQISLTFNTTEEGKEFLVRFHRFLDVYGHRSPKYDLFFPSWSENPDLVLELLRTYLTSKTPFSPKFMEEHSIKERGEATELILDSLNTRILDRIFPIKRAVFLKLLRLAQKYMSLRENQQFYIGQGYPIARKIVIQIGSRFVDMKIIQEPLDIFFLSLDEIRDLVFRKKDHDGIANSVKERKSEYEMYRKVESPPLITKGGIKGWGRKEILRGTGGSLGIVTGEVRIISDIQDFTRFKEGEILVAPTTNPSWTPLFMMAKGVVTEVGGLLTHGAVVAREYGIPAVLGVKNATRILKNGQKITLDGGNGMVYPID